MAGIAASISWLGSQLSSSHNNLPALALSLILLALLLDYVKWRRRSSRWPPGPTPLPFIGNLLLLDLKNPHKSVQDLEKKFGPAIFLQVGWRNMVILSGFKTIKEALGRNPENFVDRAPVPLLNLINHGKNCEGITVATCDNGWREQRRFIVSLLNNFVRGKPTLEERVSEEAGYLCSEFKSKEGSPFDPQILIYRAVNNIICTLTLGDRFEYSDEKFLNIMHLTEEILKEVTRNLPQLIVAGSWFSCFPGPHRKLQKHYEEVSTTLREIVNEHKKTRDPTFPRDLIDAFLDEMDKAKGKPENSFNERNLINIIFELFGAASDTISSTLLYGLLNIVDHPEVQKRVQEEIDEEIGRVRSPVMEDQLKLPYTCAVLHEIQRCADVLPVAAPYMTHTDIEVGKFIIPKETAVFNHLSSVLKDETMWEKPHDFYPEHFLDADGQFVKREAFLPFSLGRHACPGERWARMELFLFFTSLLQHFTFRIPENYPRPKTERLFALTVHPAPFQISAIPR
ncbi:cytochrome P450 2D14-like isoform X2 [Lacerta agilis]|uniref:cytochrome P450 2D14-like isoform X2 n=1 Tax=Lacerta agilis TaxID=80427 RepID=UPI00141A669C|nr:cytochrome P450 2D14-like isoform X2 [Lacerta agilis]